MITYVVWCGGAGLFIVASLVLDWWHDRRERREACMRRHPANGDLAEF